MQSHRIRPTRLNKRPRPRTLKVRSSGRKKREEDIKDNKAGEKYETIAPYTKDVIPLRP